MIDMVLQCERCGKGIMRGHNVSHAKNRTKRVFKPNLQTLRVLQKDGTRKKTTLCSKCVRIVRKEASQVAPIRQTQGEQVAQVAKAEGIKKVFGDTGSSKSKKRIEK